MRVELLENTERRRRWSFDDKARIVEAAFETGVSVCSVARRHGIAQGLLFTW
ncbi:transposase, partial [Methylobacterium sp. J-077]|uniref:transposase n=1 Tax=Methylobacterium sp. J-077 TaxID=2836656 RepID=UPI001FBA30C6